jgi:hypothetical protein
MENSVDWNFESNVISIVESANKLSLVLYILTWNMLLLPSKAISSYVNMSEFLSRLLRKPDNCTYC